MSGLPRHSSLEREFFAAVPPRRTPWRRRLVWWWLLRVVALPPVQTYLQRKYRS